MKLDGNRARRCHDIAAARAVLWDAALPGFGLRVRRGHKHGSWVVRLRFRSADKLVTLGRSPEVDAGTAREMARSRLAAVTLDGLPQRTAVAASPTFATYVVEFLRDYARHWKPATERSSRGLINRDLITADLVSLALEHGEWKGDRCRLDCRSLKRLIASIDQTRSTAIRALDKGGLEVVEAGAQLITAYPISKKRTVRR